MTKHTITIAYGGCRTIALAGGHAIEIDVPDEMLAAVHDAAHRAISLIQADVLHDMKNFNQSINLIEDEEAKASLIAHKQLTAKAANIVMNALSEIMQVMNEANSAWMRSRKL